MFSWVSNPSDPTPSCSGCAALMKEVLALKEVVEKLGAEIARLKGRKAPTSRRASRLQRMSR